MPTAKKSAKAGKDVFLAVSGKGGKATLKKYGRTHFSDLAKKMHAKRKKALKKQKAIDAKK